jgi:hypothetical protein
MKSDVVFSTWVRWGLRGSRLAFAPDMNLQRSLSGWVLLPLLAGLAGCSGADESAPSELSPATASQPFSTTPGEPNHEEITALGLSFLRADILTAFQAANVATDVEYALQNDERFGIWGGLSERERRKLKRRAG